jgi:glucose/mannose transport system permease protein
MTSKSTSLKIITIIALVGLSFFYILPIYVMLITSVKPISEITIGNYLTPTLHPQFSNFTDVLRGTASMPTSMLPRLYNSILISVSVTVLALLLGGLGGYYLARTRNTFNRVLFVLVGIALYLPYQAVIIPLVIIVSRFRLWLMGIGVLLGPHLGIPNLRSMIADSNTITYLGMIFSYLVLTIPLASVLLGTFFLSVPRELEESAQVDGASRLQIFFKIVAPISMPAYVSVAIIIFTQVWNEFFLALCLSTTPTQTVQVTMAEFKGTTLVLYNLQMAAALIATAVPLLIFLFLGRYFVRGILAGALKG